MFDLNAVISISLFLGLLIGIAQKMGSFWLLLLSYLLIGVYYFVLLHQAVSTVAEILGIGG